jgi:hypothetical protein
MTSEPPSSRNRISPLRSHSTATGRSAASASSLRPAAHKHDTLSRMACSCANFRPVPSNALRRASAHSQADRICCASSPRISSVMAVSSSSSAVICATPSAGDKCSERVTATNPGRGGRLSRTRSRSTAARSLGSVNLSAVVRPSSSWLAAPARSPRRTRNRALRQ